MKRFSLSAEERIKEKKIFERIYDKGITVFSEDHKIKAIFAADVPGENTSVKIAVAVHKKAGNAVWRNKIKRLLRESYRLNKYMLIDFCKEKNIGLHIIFSSNTLNSRTDKFVRLKEIMPRIIEIMYKIKRQV